MTDIETVRLLTGDKDILAYVFTNAEVQVFLTLNGDSINLASATLLEAWAAQYSANADNEKIGDYSYTQTIVNKMLALATRLRETDALTPAMDWASFNFTDIEEVV
uniref:Uncharacterized protein n=1 Tax=viral metagenome TaxID=1070528 RepID=A0A6M3LYT4_9ZZZZ